MDRLVSVQGPQPKTFVHDPAGNLLSAYDGHDQQPTEQNNSKQVQQNRLNFFGDQHYAYDDQGNRTQTLRGKGQQLVTHFTYDALNQLIKVDNQGDITEYEYDPLGRRIAKRSAKKTTSFLWNDDVLLSETQTKTSGEGAKETQHKTYLFEPDSFNPVAFVQDNDIYHYHTDHLGTPQDITNAKGKIVWSANYRAYGNLALANVEEVENNLRFQGQYFDEESGLHYNRFRYYDPNCGRFINQDPIGLMGGLNGYQYVPNPVQWVDPLGLTAAKEDPSRQAKAIADVQQQMQPQVKPDFYVGPAGPEATLPSTGYRYMGYKNADGSVNKYAQAAIDTNQARLSYFGFEKLKTGDAVTEAFQIRAPKHVTPLDPEPAWSDGRLRLEFDTLQLYSEGKPRVSVPYSHGGKGSELEPFTTAYPEYGSGGAQQLVPNETLEITADKVDILPGD